MILLGLGEIIPAAMLPLFAWNEIEREVCGSVQIDIDVLRRNAVFEGYTVQHFQACSIELTCWAGGF